MHAQVSCAQNAPRSLIIDELVNGAIALGVHCKTCWACPQATYREYVASQALSPDRLMSAAMGCRRSREEL